MKRPKADSDQVRAEPGEMCADKAKEAIQACERRPVGEYILDLGEVLRRLADQFDPSGKVKSQWQFRRIHQLTRPPTETQRARRIEFVEDWEGTFDQISDAIENGHATAIGLYFREASSALGCLANTLDPPQNSEGPHLKFVRKGRGRPPALPGRRRHADYDIAMDLASETRRAGKQESATAVIRQKTGLSRASIHRAIKRVSVLRKSHKKR